MLHRGLFAAGGGVSRVRITRKGLEVELVGQTVLGGVLIRMVQKSLLLILVLGREQDFPDTTLLLRSESLDRDRGALVGVQGQRCEVSL